MQELTISEQEAINGGTNIWYEDSSALGAAAGIAAGVAPFCGEGAPVVAGVAGELGFASGVCWVMGWLSSHI